MNNALQSSAEFKAKVALEALKGLKIINESASDTGVHPNSIGLWKQQALEELPQIFEVSKSQLRLSVKICKVLQPWQNLAL